MAQRNRRAAEWAAAAAASFLTLAAAACSGSPTAPTPFMPELTLGGMFETAFVVRAPDGAPLAAAHVDVLDGEAAGATCVTGGDGQCTLTVPRWPAPTVRARKDGFVPHIWTAEPPHFDTTLQPIVP